MDILYIIAGLVLLIFGGEFLLKGAISLSLRLNISKVVIGMTVVSFATSAPELIVSLKSAINGHADIALGNVIGSNIANLGFVLGFTLLFTKIYVNRSFARLDWPVMIIASVCLFLFLIRDGELGQIEGAVLFALLILYLILYLKYYSKTTFFEEDDIEEDLDQEPVGQGKTLLFLVLGGVALWGGSELLIEGAVNLATRIGVSERVIGITIVSIGTSIPELAASLIAVYRKEKAISLGNLIGSNVFNILAVLGITSMITPIGVQDQRLIDQDIWWMLGFALVVLPLVYIPYRRQLAWREGILLLGAYVFFVYKTVA